MLADVRREIATTEVIKTMTFTVDRLSLLVWVWTVQSLRCAHFCDPKPAYVHPPEPNLFVFLIPPLPRLQSPSASQQKHKDLSLHGVQLICLKYTLTFCSSLQTLSSEAEQR